MKGRSFTSIEALEEALAASQREREQLQARVAGMEVAIRFALSQNPVCSAGWIKVLNDALSQPAAPVQTEASAFEHCENCGTDLPEGCGGTFIEQDACIYPRSSHVER